MRPKQIGSPNPRYYSQDSIRRDEELPLIGMTRRTFLATAAALALTPRLHARSPTAIGVQLYTVRRLLSADWEGTLAALGAIGYREMEFAGTFGQSPDAIRRVLDRHHLTAPAGHADKADLLGASSAALDSAAALGHRWLIVAWIAAAERRTLDDWRRVADQLNRAAERCRSAGLRFAYHNHDFEFASLEGKRPYDLLLEATDPALVELELDLYWVRHAGHDPVTYLRHTQGRVRLVHVKDSAGPPEHRMVDVGSGTTPWKTVLGVAKEVGVRHYFVEHDQPADPLASCRTSYDYLSRLEF